MTFIGFVIAVFAGGYAYRLWMKGANLRRAEFVRTYRWPRGLLVKLMKEHNVDRKKAALVSRGLRQFFIAYVMSGRKPVSMPSKIADALWHEFILYTRDYNKFCQQAFGGYMHHTPAAVLTPGERQSNEGLRRVWWYACTYENIDPRNPTRLPLLFALDDKLSVPDGYRYEADCEALRRQGIHGGQCGGDFTSTTYDGSVDGLGDSGGEGGAGEGGGGGEGGCGGSSCGGGCGGGD